MATPLEEPTPSDQLRALRLGLERALGQLDALGLSHAAAYVDMSLHCLDPARCLTPSGDLSAPH